MTKLAAEAISYMIDREADRQEANKRIIERMRNAPDLGTDGVIRWTRDEVHER